MSDTRLVVQADDLGMCRAVNEGIGLAKTDGILTQTSVMAPTPWFAEGAAMAKRLGIATGLHLTLTCDWQYYRWSPLTSGASLRDPDGTFKSTVEAAKADDVDEAIAEGHAQIDRAEALGLTIGYVDPHMGISVVPAYEAACARLGVKFMYPGPQPHHRFESIVYLSVQSRRDRGAWFADHLDQLGPGTHMVQSHPAVASAELRAMEPEDSRNFFWTEPTRVPDLEALCAPEVRKVVEARGIELVGVQDL
ncbi:MAG TPA: ChbG/HpnK family deacetylase [Acidimicrobiales bacterium]|nr:ChbG/HpnK family deacetylase [Acidimicrobiales bacterium]